MAGKGRPPVRQKKLSGGKPRGKVRRKLSAYNRHVQRVMKQGKTMKQAAASWRSGRKPSTRTRRATTSVRRPATRRRAARKTKVRKVGKSGFNTQKIMKYVRLAALGAPAAAIAMGAGTPEQKIRSGIVRYTGFNMDTGEFSFASLAKGWTPFAAATAVTYGIPKLAGIIRGL